MTHRTATQAWLKILYDIMNKGKHVDVKNTQTKEILANSSWFDMNFPYIEHPKRFVNKKFLAAEAYAICHGDNRTENIGKYNKNILQFSDDGYIFNGSYGPPFNNQLMYVVNTLLRDPSSRQAVLTIWKQNPVESKDIRCTLSLQFIIRDGKIHTYVNMRSSDAIWGLTYDFPVFTFMTLRVLTLLNENWETVDEAPIKLGNMYWSAFSSHVYEYHYELANSILGYDGEMPTPTIIPQNFTLDWKTVTDHLHSEMGDTDEGSDY